ncbi:MAG: rhodanese-like domain-containing protein [Chryseobacterium sp.]|nr:MAG: rhodanese-like domain-containing protein [Chryseobacterium sp.]
MKKLFKIFALLLVFTLSACAVQDTGSATKDAFLVDVRTPEEFAEGSVPGAVNIPIEVLPENIDRFRGKGNVVVFCRTGNKAGKAKKILDEAGIKNVRNGGTWKEVKEEMEENRDVR